jgi:D-alanyl-lipoteichoic acid acyltransferase DltB (MBOAT superfamily)
MLFNSVAFLVFAPVFYLGYFNLRGKVRLLWCTLASYFFYAWWDWRFTGLLFASTCIAFTCGKRINESKCEFYRKLWLWLCVGSHLATLAFFKYLNFALESLSTICHWLGFGLPHERLGILLPVGISFFTFTALSYVIDIYRGKIQQSEPSFLVFATYECLFPHLVAGPILRASSFLPQLKIDQAFDSNQLGRGLELIGWGFFLKLCLADNAAMFADPRFTDPELFTSASLALAVLAFALQIYGDFAGYSLIAIGLARIMGYDFGVNFDRPYFSSSFSDFWQRWHISLSRWIRDYLYIPLGGNRCGGVRNAWNLIVTMFLAGLWHGAGWNYVIWGMLHGAYLVVQRLIAVPYGRVCAAVQCPKWLAEVVSGGAVFALTCVAWVFFRAKTVEHGVYMLKALFSWRATAHLSFGGMKYQLVRVGFVAAVVLLVDALSERTWLRSRFEELAYGRVAAAGLMMLAILFTGSFAANSFIYFQF